MMDKKKSNATQSHMHTLTSELQTHPYTDVQIQPCSSRRRLDFNYQQTVYKQKNPFNGPFSRTTQVSRYQKGKTNLDFTEARDNEWQWHQLEHMQVCTSLQTDNHARTPPLSFLQAGCSSCRPTNSVKALKASISNKVAKIIKIG